MRSLTRTRPRRILLEGMEPDVALDHAAATADISIRLYKEVIIICMYHYRYSYFIIILYILYIVVLLKSQLDEEFLNFWR